MPYFQQTSGAVEHFHFYFLFFAKDSSSYMHPTHTTPYPQSIEQQLANVLINLGCINFCKWVQPRLEFRPVGWFMTEYLGLLIKWISSRDFGLYQGTKSDQVGHVLYTYVHTALLFNLNFGEVNVLSINKGI